mmetsp:Transcript_3835/g.7426  ORF Transcript_3835/g.7426 Transcript_3835/m.7426 type:complete len:212 (+) Transcript_3835:698-1333(+)
MSDVSERRKPCLSASMMATNDTSGRSRPSRSILQPMSTSYWPLRSPSIASRRSTGFRSECSHAAGTPRASRKRASSSADRFVSTVTSVFSPTARRDSICASRWSSTPPTSSALMTRTCGSGTPVGRTISSVTDGDMPHKRSTSAPGVAEMSTACGTRAQNSALVSGRLSSADGRRKPCATRLRLRWWSPANMAEICGAVMWHSSTRSSQSS